MRALIDEFSLLWNESAKRDASANGPERPWLILNVRQNIMIDVENFAGAKIALLIMDYSESEEGEGYVIDGHGKIRDGKLFLDHGTDTDFPVPEDSYDRIKPVTPAQAQIVGDAQFLLILTAGPKPDDGEDYTPTGLRLPRREKEA